MAEFVSFESRGRLVLVVDIGGEIALDAIKDDLVRRLDAHPLYRVMAAKWREDFDGESGSQAPRSGHLSVDAGADTSRSSGG